MSQNTKEWGGPKICVTVYHNSKLDLGFDKPCFDHVQTFLNMPRRTCFKMRLSVLSKRSVNIEVYTYYFIVCNSIVLAVDCYCIQNREPSLYLSFDDLFLSLV